MRKPRFLRYLIAGFLLIMIGAFWAIGTKNRTYDGVLQHGFETSDFYPLADCSASPFWFEATGNAAEQLNRRWMELGRPNALHLQFVGDMSRVGFWGHLGKYRREIQPSKILEVEQTDLACK